MDPKSNHRSSIFLAEALNNLFNNEDIREPLRVAPVSKFVLFATLTALLLSILVTILVAKVSIYNERRVKIVFSDDDKITNTQKNPLRFLPVSFPRPVRTVLREESSLLLVNQGDVVLIELEPRRSKGGELIKDRISPFGSNQCLVSEGESTWVEGMPEGELNYFETMYLLQCSVKRCMVAISSGMRFLVRVIPVRQRLTLHCLDRFADKWE